MNDFTPLCLGFDPRRHKMTVVLSRAARKVRFDLKGLTQEVSGSTLQLVKALKCAGYRVDVE